MSRSQDGNPQKGPTRGTYCSGYLPLTSLHERDSLQCNTCESSEERCRKYLSVEDVNCMIFCALWVWCRKLYGLSASQKASVCSVSKIIPKEPVCLILCVGLQCGCSVTSMTLHWPSPALCFLVVGLYFYILANEPTHVWKEQGVPKIPSFFFFYGTLDAL